MRTNCAISYAASEIALLRSLENVQLIGNICPEARIVHNLGSPHSREKVKNVQLYCVLSEIAESATAHGASVIFAVG